MEFTFDNNVPIYIQLVEQLKVYIISGMLKPGERLPSVRELALLSKANPNTVQRALAELENMGLIFTERTNGKFVSTNTKNITKMREKYASVLALKFLEDMQKIGFENADALHYLEGMKGDQK